MPPEDFETYQRYSRIVEKFDARYGLDEITKEEWDIVKKILFSTKEPIKLHKNVQLSLKVAGKGMEKVPEAKAIKDRLQMKSNLLLEALGNFNKEDLDCLQPYVAEALDRVARLAESVDAHIRLPKDVQEKVLERGLASIISKLSETDDIKELSRILSVLDTKIMKNLIETEINKLMPSPTEEEMLKELRGYFGSRRGPEPMR